MSDYAKNDVITVTIEDIGSDGEGIGKVDGFTLFIKDAVIGDTVEAKIIKSKKHKKKMRKNQKKIYLIQFIDY